VRDGWHVTPLGELCDVLDHRRKPITKRDRIPGKYPYYGATGLLDHVDGYLFDEPLVLVGEDGAKWGPGDPTAFLVDGQYWVNNHAHVLRALRTRVLDAWLVYYLNCTDLTVFTSGLTVPKLNQGNLRAIPVPVPPLPEQQRIVGILDEAFEGIATAKANAEKNLLNARALIQPAFMTILSKLDQTDWRSTTVEGSAKSEKGSIRTGPFGSQLLHGEFVDQGIPVLGIDNAVQNYFAWGRRRYITPQKFAVLSRYQVRPGDVLITIMGTCGRCAVVPDDIPTAINSKHLCCITLDRRRCLPEYLHAYFLWHPAARDFLSKQAKGSIMSGLNMGLIKELPLVLPSIEQQLIIVERVSDVREASGSLEAVCERKLAALDEFKASLLHQAFSGDL